MSDDQSVPAIQDSSTTGDTRDTGEQGDPREISLGVHGRPRPRFRAGSPMRKTFFAAWPETLSSTHDHFQGGAGFAAILAARFRSARSVARSLTRASRSGTRRIAEG